MISPYEFAPGVLYPYWVLALIWHAKDEYGVFSKNRRVVC